MEREIIDRTAQAIAALDFTAENEHIAELNAKIAQLQAAIDAAEARCTEISQTLLGHNQPSGHAVADALAANVSPSEAVEAEPSPDQLKTERESLRNAIRELRWRHEDAQTNLKQIGHASHSRAIQATRDLVDAIFDDARVSAERLADCFASITAIRAATRGHTREADFLTAVIQACMSNDLMPWHPVAVPPDILKVLGQLEGHGPALRTAIISEANPQRYP